jgi:Co/Zn/Cd efflux system component
MAAELSELLRYHEIVSVLVAGLMLRGAYGLLREAGRVLLEAAPEGMEPAEIVETISAHPSVANVHDLHVWEITSGFPVVLSTQCRLGLSMYATGPSSISSSRSDDLEAHG